MMKKIALFVDVQNIYYTVKRERGCHFNYRELWRQLSCEGEIVTACAYAIDRGDAQQQGFQQILRNIGFEVKLKPYIQRHDGSAKGDWDVGLTIDVMDTFTVSETIADCLVLLSGDGDFDMLLERVGRDFGASTIVYGIPSLTAASLINAATEFRAIESSLLLNN
jgi:uncharacterized LabA/DUF88 family protein